MRKGWVETTMFSQLFGKYLVEKNIISSADYQAAIERQLDVRVKLGTIAVAEGLLTEAQVEALNKLQMAATQTPMQNGNPTTAEMFIVAPLFPSSVAKLFSTHPPIEDRIARLSQMAGQMPAQTQAQRPAAPRKSTNRFGDL